MTEAEWNASVDPLPMMAHLRHRKRITERKTRLWGVACARQAWGLLTDERSRHAVLMAEEFADGISDCIATAKMDAERLVNPHLMVGRLKTLGSAQLDGAAHLARCLCWREGIPQSSMFAEDIPGRSIASFASQCITAELAAALLREVVGNPWRRAQICTLACADPEEGYHGSTCPLGSRTVAAMARTIYAERCFEDLPILADALDDAGCEDEPILQHLRGPGPHCRGCHVLDLLLGKE